MTAITPAYAGVANNGLFELDANPQDLDTTQPPDDWATLDAGLHCYSLEFLQISASKYFDGGKKDIQDVTDWSWKNGAVPDKKMI